MRLGIVLSNAALAAPTHTTVHLACAAVERGHAVRVFEPWDFEIGEDGRLRARAHVLDGLTPSPESVALALTGRAAARRSVDVDRLDVLLLRANPLQDTILTYAQMAAAAGVRVLNDPEGMVRTSHKGYLATLVDVPRPRTLVTRSRASIERFLSECEGGVVVKPARASGGKGVALVRGRRRDELDLAIDGATRAGDGYLVVQEYLPAAADGEKRLLWLDGALIGGYLRQRAPDDFRHNLKVGGIPFPYRPTDVDRALLAVLGPHLRRDGIWFAGVDVIGDKVVEVNALNPGGVHFASRFSGESLAGRVIASLEAEPPAVPGWTPFYTVSP